MQTCQSPNSRHGPKNHRSRAISRWNHSAGYAPQRLSCVQGSHDDESTGRGSMLHAVLNVGTAARGIGDAHGKAFSTDAQPVSFASQKFALLLRLACRGQALATLLKLEMLFRLAAAYCAVRRTAPNPCTPAIALLHAPLAYRR